MHKLLSVSILISSMVFSTGCATLETVAGIADIAFDVMDDDLRHEGEVQQVTYKKESTVIHYNNGTSYEVNGHPKVKPGENIKVREKETGFEASKY